MLRRVLAALLTLLLVLPLGVPAAFANTPVTVSIVPNTMSPSLGGALLRLDFKVTNPGNMGGVDFQLSWDNNKIKLVNADVEPSFVLENPGVLGVVAKNTVTVNANGIATAWFAAATEGGASVQEGTVIAKARFQVLAEGQYGFNFSSLSVKDSATNVMVSTGQGAMVTTTGYVDTVAPTLSVSALPSSVTLANTSVAITVTSNESLKAAPTVTVTPPGGTGQPVVMTGSGSNWTGTLTIGSAAPNGTYSVSASGQDAANNTGTTSTTFSVTMDKTKPVLTVTATPDSFTSPGSVAITVSSDEALSAAPTVMVKRPDNSQVPVSVSAATSANTWTGSYTVDLSTVNGTYTVTADGSDAVGNAAVQASDTFTVNIDRNAPALTVTVDPTVVNASVNEVKVTVTSTKALSGAPAVTVTKPDSTEETVTVSAGTTANSWSGTFPVGTGVQNGSFKVSASGTDAVNGQDATSNEAAFTVDKLLPTLTITTNPTNVTALGTEVTITVTPSEALKAAPAVKVRKLGTTTEQPVTMTAGQGLAWTGTYTVANLVNGTFEVLATGEDMAGNPGTAPAGQFLVDIDLNPAALTVSVSPDKVKAGVNQVTVSVSSNKALTGTPSVKVTKPGNTEAIVTVSAGTTANSWTGTFPVSAATVDGTYKVTASGTDASNKLTAGSNEATFVVDKVAPSLGLGLVPSFVKAGTDVTVTVTSNELLANPPVVTAGSTAVDLTGTGSPWTGTFRVPDNTPNGPITFTVRGSDIVGNAVEMTATVTVDNTAPTITVTAPAPTKETTVTLTFGVTDPNLAGVKVNGEMVTATAGQYSKQISLTSGNNTVTIVATDKAGNVKTETVTVVADFEDPSISTWGPTGISGNARPKISFQASDNRATLKNATVTVKVGTGTPATFAATLTNGVYEYTPTTDLIGANAEATVEVTARIEDEVGNDATQSWTFTVNTKVPKVNATVNGAQANTAGWYKAKPTVALTATSENETVITYKLVAKDAGQPASLDTYTDALLIPEGQWDLWAKAKDNVTNLEGDPEKIGTYLVDLTAPAALTNFAAQSTDSKAVLKAGDKITFSFTADAGLTATYSLAYQTQSANGPDWTTGTAVTGGITADGSTYTGEITVPANTENWRNLVLSLTLKDAADNQTPGFEALAFTVDNILPAVTGVTFAPTHPLNQGKTLAVTVNGEAGLPKAEAFLVLLGADGQPVPGTAKTKITLAETTPGVYSGTYGVVDENRTVLVEGTLTDEAGNATTVTAPNAVVLDNTKPVITSVKVDAPSKVDLNGVAHYKTGDLIRVEVVTETGLTSASEQLQSVKVTIPGLTGVVIDLTESATAGTYIGTYEVIPTDTTQSESNPSGKIKLVAEAIDKAGNISDPVQSSNDLIVDNAPPVVVGVAATGGVLSELTGRNSLVITGLGEADLKEVKYGFTTAAGERAGALTQSATTKGLYRNTYTVVAGDDASAATVTVTFVDWAGNETVKAVEKPVVIDTTPVADGTVTLTRKRGEEVLDADAWLKAGDQLVIEYANEANLVASATVEGLTSGAVMSANGGTYTLTITITEGMNTTAAGAKVKVLAKDAGGHSKETEAAGTVKVDTLAPKAAAKLSHEPRGLAGWYVTAPTITFEFETGATAKLVVKGEEKTLTNNTWTVADGEYAQGEIVFTATDVAGNVTSVILPQVKVDTGKPGKPVFTTQTQTVNTKSFTVEGTVAEADAKKVAIYVGGAFRGMADVIPGETANTFSHTVALDEDMVNKGLNRITAKAIDRAGNQSDLSDELQLTLDKTAPSFTIILNQTAKTVQVTVNEALKAAPTMGGNLTLTAGTSTTANGQTVYPFTYTTLPDGNQIKITVQGEDLAGNVGKGNLVETKLSAATGGNVKSDDDAVSATFDGDDLAGTGDVDVSITSYIAENLNTFVPRGTKLLGSAYDFKATLKADATVDVTFKVDITGFAPEKIGIYYFPASTGGVPEKIDATVTNVVDNLDGTFTAEVNATLTHFSVYAPFGDLTAPNYVGAVKVNTVDTALSPTVKTITITGAADGSAKTLQVKSGSTVLGTQDLGATTAADKNFSVPVSLTTDGTYTLTVEVLDEFNNSNTQDITFTLDTAAPTVTDVKLNNAAYTGKVFTSAGTASVSASAAGGLLKISNSTGDIVVDAVDTVNATVTLPENQDVTFAITARDTALDANGNPTGNVSAASSVTVRRDTAVPTVRVTGLSATQTVVPAATLEIGFEAVQRVGLTDLPEDVATVSITVDNGGTVTGLDATAQSDSSVTLNLPADGTYTVTVTATDKAGNTSAPVTYTVVRASDAPVVTVTPGAVPVDQSTVDLTINSVANGNIDIYVNGALVKEDTIPGSGTYTYTATLTVEGANNVSVEVTNTANLKVGTGTAAVVRNLKPTATGITPAANSSTTGTSTTVSFTLSEPAKVVINRQLGIEAKVEAYSSDETLLTGTVTQTIDLPTVGTYSFEIVLTDSANTTNTVNVPGKITRTNPPAGGGGGGGGGIVTPAPAISVTAAKTLTKEATVEVTGTATAGATVTVTKGAETLTTFTVAASGSFTYSAALTEGENTFTFTAKNAAGTAAATVTVTRDSTVPTLTVTGPTSPTKDEKATLEISTEKGASIFVNGAAAGTADVNGKLTLTQNLVVGSNRFELYATDGAGNKSAVSTVTVVRTAKKQAKVTIGLLPQSTDKATISFGGTATEGATVTVKVGGKVVATTQATGLGYFVSVGLENGLNEIVVTAEIDGTTASAQASVLRIQAAAPVLTDVTGHWAADGIAKLVAAGVITGFEDGTFRPEEKVTRAQFAKMIVSALGLEIDPNAELTLTDASEIPAWAKPYIAAAIKAGLITGYEDGTFRAGQEITRLQIAVIISRGLKVKGLQVEGNDKTFTDANTIPTWAKADIDLAAKAGLIGGFEDGTFRPADQATRAQAAIMTLRLMEKE